MILQSPGDIAFSLFDFPVYYYGIILAAACFVGIYAAYIMFKKYSDVEEPDVLWEFSPYVVVAGILGARLYYCVLNFPYYFWHLGGIFNIREGGLSIHGAILVGIGALIYFAKKSKVPVLKLLDAFSVGTILAQSIGRWGNFFNSEAFGLPYNGFLKLYIPPSDRPAAFMNYEYFHPAFLYESILDLVIFVILFFIYKRYNVKRPGFTLAMYLILYSVARFAVEQIRIDSALNISGIPVAQIISGVIFAVGIVMLFFVFKRVKI